MGDADPALHGLLIVDKPAGCTSHDVVQRVRRAIGQRSVGHAGTLDPLATGVLVVAVGEGTKLVSHLQSDDKRYDVTVTLGTETDSLDADGEVVASVEVPSLDVAKVERALEGFLGTQLQEAPRLSAIKVKGRPLHRRARGGEDVQAPVREVELHEASVVALRENELDLSLHCGKGFYVRSLARDLARALGTLGHVKALRRTASGRFMLDDALYGDGLTREGFSERLIPLRDACRVLRSVELTEDGAEHARHGRPIDANAIVGDAWREASPEESLALFDPRGEPVAIGKRVDGALRVVRGFTTSVARVVSP